MSSKPPVRKRPARVSGSMSLICDHSGTGRASASLPPRGAPVDVALRSPRALTARTRWSARVVPTENARAVQKNTNDSESRAQARSSVPAEPGRRAGNERRRRAAVAAHQEEPARLADEREIHRLFGDQAWSELAAIGPSFDAPTADTVQRPPSPMIRTLRPVGEGRSNLVAGYPAPAVPSLATDHQPVPPARRVHRPEQVRRAAGPRPRAGRPGRSRSAAGSRSRAARPRCCR